MISPNHPNPEAALDHLLLSQEGARHAVVLSDFDYTLCHKYVFDSDTNDHQPFIEPDVIDAARGLHLVIATGRRANSQSLKTIWREGLIPEDRPIIAENGGVLVYYREDRLKFLDLIHPYIVNHIVGVKDALTEQAGDIEQPGEELVVKLGRTMLIARLQDKHGETTEEAQHRLASSIQPLLTSPDLRIVDNRVSLGIQHHSVNKAAAFARYLRIKSVPQEGTVVIGMGDGENDREIFRVADVSVGLSPIVGSIVDLELVEGPESARQVLQKVKNMPQQA